MILIINTQDPKQVSVSLKKADEIVASATGFNQYGSQTLLPLIMDILKSNKLEFKDLKGIEVSTGPGSFTGIRVGISVAQALGFALNIPVNGQINKPIEARYT